jgi:peptide/nickel transport system substrate-binding protein
MKLAHRRTRRSAAFGVIALATAFATACGSSSSEPNSAPSSAATGKGGTLTAGLTGEFFANLDTIQAMGFTGEQMTWLGLQLYDGLTSWNLKQTTDVPTVQPGLATSWTSDAKATVYTFHLRKNVKFTDGTPWNADAAVYNINRYVKPGSPGYSKDLSAAVDGFDANLGSATKIDDMTFQINMKKGVSDAFLPQSLTLIPMGSPTAIKKFGKDFASNPVGTGPFKFASQVKGQSISMVRNPDYWKGAPKLDKLVLRFIPASTSRVQALRAGEVNFMNVAPPDAISSLKSAGYQIAEAPYSNVYRGLYDVSKPPWNNLKVRLAANYAIDRASLAKNVLNGTALPVAQVASAADPGFLPDLDQKYGYNLDKAKQLLKEAGYPNGFNATMVYAATGGGTLVGSTVVQVLQSDLAKVGIKIKLIGVDFNTLNNDAYSGKITGGASMQVASGTFVLPSLWSSLVTGNFQNIGHWSDKTFDSLYTQASQTPSLTEQTTIFEKMNTIATEQASMMSVVTDESPHAFSSKVHGFIDAKSWFSDLTGVWVG